MTEREATDAALTMGDEDEGGGRSPPVVALRSRETIGAKETVDGLVGVNLVGVVLRLPPNVFVGFFWPVGVLRPPGGVSRPPHAPGGVFRPPLHPVSGLLGLPSPRLAERPRLTGGRSCSSCCC